MTNEMNGYDRKLLQALQRKTRSDGSARSLFRLAVVESGLDYPWAHNSLTKLEVLGCVQVERCGGGHALVMRITCAHRANCTYGVLSNCPLVQPQAT